MVSFRKTPADAVECVRAAAWALVHGKTYDRILTWIGQAPIVLLGGATLGTHDFYAARAALTRRMIEEHGFAAVAVDDDWCDAYDVSRYAHGLSGRDSTEVLAGFTQFPSWLWRNTAMGEFAAWLHEHNATRLGTQKVGLYGLDLYRTHAAMRTLVDTLDRSEPALASAAAANFATYDQFGDDDESNAWRHAVSSDPAWIEPLVRELALNADRCEAIDHVRRRSAMEEAFYDESREQRAVGGVPYFSSLLRGRLDAWNARHRHLADTLDELRTYLARCGRPPKIVVWSNNAAIGDAEATALGEQGRVSLGQLARGRYGPDVRRIAFTTYTGGVVAASAWRGPVEVKSLQPALSGSVEELFHHTGVPRFFLPLDSGGELRDALSEPRLQRAIGLVYHPEQERWDHYFPANIADQYDALLHVDETHPLEPLESVAEWNGAEAAIGGR